MVVSEVRIGDGADDAILEEERLRMAVAGLLKAESSTSRAKRPIDADLALSIHFDGARAPRRKRADPR